MALVDIATRNICSKPVRDERGIAWRDIQNDKYVTRVQTKATFQYSSTRYDRKQPITAGVICGWSLTKLKTSFHIYLASFSQVP